MPTVKISEVHSVDGIKPAINYAEGLNKFGKVNSKNKDHATIRKDLEKHGINPRNLKNRAVMMDGNVNPFSTSHDMVRTLHLFNDGGKNKAFRIIQSFDPKKLKYYKGQDIVKVHQAGLKLADQLSHHGKYLYLVCTHIDGGSPGGERPIHNHIIFLGTSLHGKQFRPRHLWTQVARISDKIAQQMQLGVLPDQKITNPETRKSERHDINEVKMSKRTHKMSKKEHVRQCVDQAMMDKRVTSTSSLADYLKPFGIYLILYSKKTGNELKHLTFIDKKHPSKSGRPFKVRDRTLGSDYLKETIKHGLEQKATAAARQQKERQQSTVENGTGSSLGRLAVRNRNQYQDLPAKLEPATVPMAFNNQSTSNSSQSDSEESRSSTANGSEQRTRPRRQRNPSVFASLLAAISRKANQIKQIYQRAKRKWLKQHIAKAIIRRVKEARIIIKQHIRNIQNQRENERQARKRRRRWLHDRDRGGFER